MNLNVAYYTPAIDELKAALLEHLLSKTDDYLNITTEVTINVVGWEPIKFRGDAKETIIAVDVILHKIILDHRSNPPQINSVVFNFRFDSEVGETDRFTIKDVELISREDNGQIKLKILIRSALTNQAFLKEVDFKLDPVLFKDDLDLELISGNILQASIIDLGSIDQILPILKQIENRQALYLITIATDTDIPDKIETSQIRSDKWESIDFDKFIRIFGQADTGIMISGKCGLKIPKPGSETESKKEDKKVDKDKQ